MLSDHERRTLRDLERRFSVDDPDFAASFGIDELLARVRQQAARIAVWVALALSVPMLLIGSPIGALAFAATTGLVWMSWRYSAPGERVTGTSGASGSGQEHH